ncbi:glycoside hydrolase family 97 [Sphingomonas sp. MA1305]|uniref:glycoside hydrolase family 97 protein n=1 Tax=Sphingomonas sp. MA1305 TaxID=2479204 RepID=UPI001E64A473|nr:glycoside hydrolase family 97 protein [Sphingomonas sp. MA1305]MBI0476394.1 glycoside hydrolase family 97 [Sphingomonas sp. MA1305]
MLPAADAKTVSVSSPDGTVRADLTDEAGELRYRVTIDGRAILDPSPVTMRVDGVELGNHAVIDAVRRRPFRDRYRLFGGKAWAIAHANQATLTIHSSSTPYEADVRVADDGVGVRLRLPAKPGRHVDADRSGWQLASVDPRVWASRRSAGYEEVFTTETLRSVAGKPLALPLTAKINRYWVTISEAAGVDYGDLAVTPDANGLLTGMLYADPAGWRTDKAVTQPWRVTIVARDLTKLVNSTLIQDLNPPPAPSLAHATWIRPGRSTWQWLAIGAPLETDQHRWVDWTRRLGFEYYLVDDGWAAWKTPWATLADTVAYARSQRVGVWLWVHSNMMVDAAARRALLRRFAALGVVGVKVDFPEPPDRVWSNWYAAVARDAAAERLMIDFHGAVKPTGTERTWPNVLTREAVRGHEWQITRYNRVLPAEHDTIIPFTRYVIGPGDYTPTVFAANELQGNSWAHELAQAIIFTSPFLTMGGHPRTYLDNPAADLLRAIPAVWDETIVLPGSEPGVMAGFARRRDKDWFIGVINGPKDRLLSLDLRFLGRGEWSLVSLTDDPARPAAFVRSQRDVRSTDSIATGLRGRGGLVAWLRPRPKAGS